MPDRSSRDVLTGAARLGVPPLLLGGGPWAIRSDLLAWVAEAARFPEHTGPAQAARPAARQPRTGVAVVPLTGIITPQGSFLSFLFGGAPGGLLAFREALQEAVSSPEVGTIILDVDSPGGLVDLVPETAAEVRAARDVKDVIAVADTQMNSAAYWIASQASTVVATPSGDAGSIGVYRVHDDLSGLNAQIGIKVTYIHAGDRKVDGNPDEPLSPTAIADWQADVDDVYELFVADVAAGRGVSEATVLSDFGEGRTMNARRALDAGLVDRIATFDEVVGELLGQVPEGAHATDPVPPKLASGAQQLAALFLS